MNKTKKEKKAKNKEKPNLLLPKTKPAEMKEKKIQYLFTNGIYMPRIMTMTTNLYSTEKNKLYRFGRKQFGNKLRI